MEALVDPLRVLHVVTAVTGAGLMMARGLGWSSLVTTPSLGLKFLLLVLMGALLSYVSLRIQPEIDALFARAGGMPSGDVATRIAVLRLRRKRLAALCFFGVLTATVLGVQLWSAMSTELAGLLVAAGAAFSWRAYSTTTPYGWI